jgi:Meiotically Up-regulated Gene 113 (MUG113) protein
VEGMAAHDNGRESLPQQPDNSMEKQDIIAEIQRTATLNGGVPLGIDRFRQATGIRKEDWYGVFWARWTDAQVEAGFQPNQFGRPAFGADRLAAAVAALTRELGQFPTKPELKIHKRRQKDFPSDVTLRRHLGTKVDMLASVLEFCLSHDEWQDVAEICAVEQSKTPAAVAPADAGAHADEVGVIGHVYLLQHQNAYKIGRSVDATQRYRQIRTQMPHETREIHLIETDDPAGIEAYWHNRFRDKRLQGEWFALSTEDVKAFRRRKFM